MTRLVKLTVFASALALAGLGASSFALADKLPSPPPCIECIPGGGGGPPGGGNDQNQGGPGRHRPQVELPEGQNGPDQGGPRHWHRPDNQQGAGDNAPDLGMPYRHARKYHPDNQYNQGGNEDAGIDQKRTHHTDRKWVYDPNRHQRRHHRDSRFRFYFGGFWYPEPYWDEPYYYDDYYDRVSCREGAEIVAERFARVRILDCDGRVYTYLGRRYGETFEIELSSRTGRILDAHEI